MVEKKAFLPNPEHQCCVSQCGEHDYSAHNKKKGNYYEHPSLTLFTVESLILSKMAQRKAFITDPKYQYRLSQRK